MREWSRRLHACPYPRYGALGYLVPQSPQPSPPVQPGKACKTLRVERRLGRPRDAGARAWAGSRNERGGRTRQAALCTCLAAPGQRLELAGPQRYCHICHSTPTARAPRCPRPATWPKLWGPPPARVRVDMTRALSTPPLKPAANAGPAAAPGARALRPHCCCCTRGRLPAVASMPARRFQRCDWCCADAEPWH
jgi:hypothetical protein